MTELVPGLIETGLILSGWLYIAAKDFQTRLVNLYSLIPLAILGLAYTEPVSFAASAIFYIPATIFSHTNKAFSRGDTAMIATSLFTSQIFDSLQVFFNILIITGVLAYLEQKGLVDDIAFAPVIFISHLLG